MATAKTLAKIELPRDIPRTLSGLYERLWREFVRYLSNYTIAEDDAPLFVQLINTAYDNDVVDCEVDECGAKGDSELVSMVTGWCYQRIGEWASKVEDAIEQLRHAYFPNAGVVYISEDPNPLPNLSTIDIHVSTTCVRITVPVDDWHYLRVDVALEQ